jgi:hypothetical protein
MQKGGSLCELYKGKAYKRKSGGLLLFDEFIMPQLAASAKRRPKCRESAG